MGWGDPRKKKKLKKSGCVPPPPPPPNVNFHPSSSPPALQQKVVSNAKTQAPVSLIHPETKSSVPPPPPLPKVNFYSSCPPQPSALFQNVDKHRVPVSPINPEVKSSVPPQPPLPKDTPKKVLPPLPSHSPTLDREQLPSTILKPPPPPLPKQPPPPPPLPLLNGTTEVSPKPKLATFASVPKPPPPPSLLLENSTPLKFKFSKESSSSDFASAILASKTNLTKYIPSETLSNEPKIPSTLAEELKTKLASAKLSVSSFYSSVQQVPFRLPPLPTTVILKPISQTVPSKKEDPSNTQLRSAIPVIIRSPPEDTPIKASITPPPIPCKPISQKKHPPPPPPVQSCTPPPLPPAKRPTKKNSSPFLVKPRKYHTDYKKRDKPKFPLKPRFATAPVDHHHHHHRHESRSGNRVVVSLISQSEYMKRHLFVKSGVDRSRTVSKYQVKRATLRTYIPKMISQEINMGMWI